MRKGERSGRATTYIAQATRKKALSVSEAFHRCQNDVMQPHSSTHGNLAGPGRMIFQKTTCWTSSMRALLVGAVFVGHPALHATRSFSAALLSIAVRKRVHSLPNLIFWLNEPDAFGPRNFYRNLRCVVVLLTPGVLFQARLLQ